MSADYAKLLGHQNPKQKIHYVTRLKDENVALKQVVTYILPGTYDSLKSLKQWHSQDGYWLVRLVAYLSIYSNRTINDTIKTVSKFRLCLPTN